MSGERPSDCIKRLTLAIKHMALASFATCSQQLSQQTPIPVFPANRELLLLGKTTVEEGPHQRMRDEAGEMLQYQLSLFLSPPAK